MALAKLYDSDGDMETLSGVRMKLIDCIESNSVNFEQNSEENPSAEKKDQNCLSFLSLKLKNLRAGTYLIFCKVDFYIESANRQVILNTFGPL